MLVQGKPFSIPWIKENIPAIVEAWYPGEMGGLSVAEVLLGRINPSGKIPVSFPKSVGHLPCYYNHLPTDQRIFINNRATMANQEGIMCFPSPEPLWPFGYGLSYTKFDYESMHLSSDQFNL